MVAGTFLADGRNLVADVVPAADVVRLVVADVALLPDEAFAVDVAPVVLAAD